MRTISSHSELTPNHVPGSEMPPLDGLVGVPDDNGQPLLFGLQEPGRLLLVMHDRSALACWVEIDLGSQIAPGHPVHVQTYALAHKPDGTLRLAVVAVVPHLSGAQRLLYFDSVPASADPAVWAAALTEPLELEHGEMLLDEVHLGSEDQQAAAIVVRGHDPADKVLHRMVNADPVQDPSWTSKPLQLPPRAQACHALASGYIEQGPARTVTPGFYSICDVGEDVPLVSFTTFPTGDAPATVQEMFGVKDKRSLAAVPAVDLQDGTRYTDLFTGGALLFEYGLFAQRNPTVPPTALADFADDLGGDASRICACIDLASGQRDVFTLSPPDGRLFRSRGVPVLDENGRRQISWLPPVLIAREVTSCATWRRAGTAPGVGSTLYLAIGYQDGSLEVLFQDPLSGLWQHETVVLDGERTYSEITTFSTRITVTDEVHAPERGVAVRVTPQYPCSAFVDGQLTHFTTLVPTVVTTGPDGGVTIVQRTRSLGSPTFSVQADDATDHDLQPHANVRSRIDALLTRDDIRLAQRSSGGPLFPDGKDDASCDSALAGLAQLRTVSDDLAGGTARWAAPGSAGDDGSVLDAGDLFAWLWEQDAAAVEWGISELPDGTRAFFAKVGESVWSFLISVGAQILEAADWVLRTTLGITSEDLVDWLGFVFDWTDIRANHEAIRNTLIATLGHVVGTAAAVKGQIASRAAQAKELLAQGLPVPTTAAAKELMTGSTRQQAGRAPTPQADASGAHTPQAQWGQSKISAYDRFTTLGETGIDGIADRLADLSEHEQAILVATIKEFQARVLPNLTTLPFGDLLAIVLEIVGDGVIDGLEAVAGTVVDVGMLCLLAVRSFLDTRIDIPVLTAFYEETVAPGSRFTLLDVACLATATFSTVVFKATMGQNLYSPEQLILLENPDVTFADVLVAYSTPRTVHGRQPTDDLKDMFGSAILLVGMAGNRFPLTWFWIEVNVGVDVVPRVTDVALSLVFEVVNYVLALTYWILKLSLSPNAHKDWFTQASWLTYVSFFIRARQVYNYSELSRGHVPPRANFALQAMESFGGILMIVAQVQSTIGQANDPPAGVPQEPAHLAAWKTDISFAAVGNLSAGLQYGATALQSYVSPDVWEEIQIARGAAQAFQLVAIVMRASTQCYMAVQGLRAQFSGVV